MQTMNIFDVPYQPIYVGCGQFHIDINFSTSKKVHVLNLHLRMYGTLYV